MVVLHFNMVRVVKLMQPLPVYVRCLHWAVDRGIRYECVHLHGHSGPHIGGVIGRNYSWTD